MQHEVNIFIYACQCMQCEGMNAIKSCIQWCNAKRNPNEYIPFSISLQSFSFILFLLSSHTISLISFSILYLLCLLFSTINTSLYRSTPSSLSLFLLCLPSLFILPYFSPSCNCRWCPLLSLLAVQSLHLVPVTVHVWHSETETLVLAADTCPCPKFNPISCGPRYQTYCTT